MKTTFISTSSINNATREARTDLQVKLAQGQKEATTGRLADVGLSLGYLTERTVSMRQDLDRLTTFKDTNTIASSRLELSQTTLEGIGDSAQEFLSTLVAARAAPSSSGVAVNDAKAKLTSFIASMNSAVNGAQLFSGINTDVKPINNYYSDPPSAGRDAISAVFETTFGTQISGGDPTTLSNISASDMQAFLDGEYADLFAPNAWKSTWSQASDQNIATRISTNERIETSANANADPFRNLASIYSMISDFPLDKLDEQTYQVVLDKAIAVVGQAIGDLTGLRAQLGTSQERIAAANDRMDLQKTILNEHVNFLEGVDPYEASANVNALLTQIQTAYALTARLQNLSLVKYI
jgi:flagellar hook-associated protein 3 FlgL